MAKDAQEVQVIKTNIRKVQVPGDWSKTKGLVDEVSLLSKDIEKILEELSIKYKKLNDKLIEAYKAAPSTDSGYGASPIAAGRIFHALKGHLLKKDLRIDSTFIGDTTKFPNFSDYLKEATSWLLKFS